VENDTGIEDATSEACLPQSHYPDIIYKYIYIYKGDLKFALKNKIFSKLPKVIRRN
jgi:hypothetical protein